VPPPRLNSNGGGGGSASSSDFERRLRRGGHSRERRARPSAAVGRRQPVYNGAGQSAAILATSDAGRPSQELGRRCFTGAGSERRRGQRSRPKAAGSHQNPIGRPPPARAGREGADCSRRRNLSDGRQTRSGWAILLGRRFWLPAGFTGNKGGPNPDQREKKKKRPVLTANEYHQGCRFGGTREAGLGTGLRASPHWPEVLSTVLAGCGELPTDAGGPGEGMIAEFTFFFRPYSIEAFGGTSEQFKDTMGFRILLGRHCFFFLFRPAARRRAHERVLYFSRAGRNLSKRTQKRRATGISRCTRKSACSRFGRSATRGAGRPTPADQL